MANTDVSHTGASYGSAQFRGDLINTKTVSNRSNGRLSEFFNSDSAKTSQYQGLGFLPKHPRFHRFYNQAIGAMFVLMVAPLLLIISAMLLVAQGRPIFYRGERVGQNNTTFGILKFRSLDSEKAKALTSDKVLAPGTGAETKMGLFLRDTRLDELPQLINVMLGDMNLCGPRPVRREIMEIYEAEIPNYSERFAVKPGLIGPTQAMMYHGTSKAIRSRLNNQFCRTFVSYRKELALVFTVAACVFARSVSKTVEVVLNKVFPNRPTAAERTAQKYKVVVEDALGQPIAAKAIDKAFVQFAADADVPTEGRMVLTLPNGRKRSAIVLLAAEDGGFAYTAKTELGIHMISRYLHQQVVVPHHSEFVLAPLLSLLSPRLRNS